MEVNSTYSHEIFTFLQVSAGFSVGNLHFQHPWRSFSQTISPSSPDKSPHVTFPRLTPRFLHVHAKVKQKPGGFFLLNNTTFLTWLENNEKGGWDLNSAREEGDGGEKNAAHRSFNSEMAKPKSRHFLSALNYLFDFFSFCSVVFPRLLCFLLSSCRRVEIWNLLSTLNGSRSIIECMQHWK